MRTGTLWTILGVITAIVIAWVLVNIVFAAIAFLFKLVVVAVVALVVYLVLRVSFSRSDS